MKTIVDAKPFSDALANACTVPRKSRIPCLNEVYVHAYNDLILYGEILKT